MGGQSYDSTKNYRVILKFERFSHLSYRSFELGSSIGFKYPSHFYWGMTRYNHIIPNQDLKKHNLKENHNNLQN